MKSDCFSCKNSFDYSKIHFWLLFFLITFGSGLVWMLFRQSWLVLLILIVLLSLVSKQFKIQICILGSDRIVISKSFLGIKYYYSNYKFDKIFYSEINRTISFVGQDNSQIFYFSDYLFFIDNARKIILGNKRESDFMYSQLCNVIKENFS